MKHDKEYNHIFKWYKNSSGNWMIKSKMISGKGFDTMVIKPTKDDSREKVNGFNYDVFLNGEIWDSYVTFEQAKKESEIWI